MSWVDVLRPRVDDDKTSSPPILTGMMLLEYEMPEKAGRNFITAFWGRRQRSCARI